MAPTLKADDVATLAFAKSEVRKHDPKMALRLTPVNKQNEFLLEDLSAYARQPARGPTMLAHLVAMLA